MIKSLEDALIAFAYVMVIPGHFLLLATFRRVNFLTRLFATAAYSVGSTAALMWLIEGYGWTAVWRTAMDFPALQLGIFGHMVRAMFFLALASPVIAAGLAIDTFRYRYGYVRTSLGKVLIAGRHMKTSQGKVFVPTR